ncbi:Flp pilus assembly protein CpaB [Pseudalkalibacillus sp. SCS-8]|uniref:Flp pilus assembly protein CpaB n=1 Tax=Pseudalkalibacillus nanhaiensis TaxID=3115291 RepID=UPI0032DBE3C9
MRSKLVLTLAIVMGLITTFLFFDYMKQFNAETVATKTKMEVVVAAQEIERNTAITEDMLEIRLLPEEGVHENAVTDIKLAINQYSTADLASGEPVLSHHLQNGKEETLFVSRKIRDGYRAVSIGLNFPQSVSNLIEPDDQVDVIATKKNGEKIETEFAVENVRILAVGRRMIETTEGEPYVEYTSATVEVQPHQAVELVNAMESGTVHIALRTRVQSKEEADSDDK